MKNFAEMLKKESVKNNSLTENGAVANSGTSNELVDVFAILGGARNIPEASFTSKLAGAYLYDPELFVKSIFYCRDVRGGLGERKVARTMLTWLANNYPDALRENIKYIPEFGRWDDVYSLVGTKLEKEAFDLIKTQLDADIKLAAKSKPFSILAKWLKSINASSAESKALGNKTAKALGLTPKKYRKILSDLRSKLNILERNMSEKEWEKVQYELLPSHAMNKHKAAFIRNDNERYEEYLKSLANGTAKVNSKTLYPYDIIRDYLNCGWQDFDLVGDTRLAEAQWKELPNYVEGEHNFLVMADTSGSMFSPNKTPISTSIGLSIYFAERNKGIWHNKFLTFSGEPEFITLRGETLRDKIKCFKGIVANTNIEAAMQLILDTAVSNNLSQEELPESLIIISDMQFDAMTQRSDVNFYDNMVGRFAEKGYKLPNVVFWNVNGKANTYHALSDVKGCQMASGSSPSVFSTLVGSVGLTPEEYMLKVLNDERYSCITVKK